MVVKGCIGLQNTPSLLREADVAIALKLSESLVEDAKAGQLAPYSFG
jgi:hypothetical protein